jgi:hypothetical protein
MQCCTSEPTSRPNRASVWGAGDNGWPFCELLAPDFRVQRRSSERWPVAGTATLLALGGGLGTLVELDALEGAPWWISGRASMPITPGTRVSVGFSDPNGRPAVGVVVRCGERPANSDVDHPAVARFVVAVRFEGDQLL